MVRICEPLANYCLAGGVATLAQWDIQAKQSYIAAWLRSPSSVVQCEHAPELPDSSSHEDTHTQMQMHRFYACLHSQRDLPCH